MRLKGKTAFITGATSGIGAVMARRGAPLGAEGATAYGVFARAVQGVSERHDCALPPGSGGTAAGRAGMLAWEHANAQHKHGRHRYTLADAGLTPADVARSFAAYQERMAGYF